MLSPALRSISCPWLRSARCLGFWNRSGLYSECFLALFTVCSPIASPSGLTGHLLAAVLPTRPENHSLSSSQFCLGSSFSSEHPAAASRRWVYSVQAYLSCPLPSLGATSLLLTAVPTGPSTSLACGKYIIERTNENYNVAPSLKMCRMGGTQGQLTRVRAGNGKLCAVGVC